LTESHVEDGAMMRRFPTPLLGLGAVIALLGMGVPPAAAEVRGPLVIMMKNPIPREGSLEDCIYRQIVGGKTISDAIRECTTLQPPPAEAPPGGLLGSDLLNRGGKDAAVATCATFSNPRAEGHSPGWEEAKAHAMAIQLGKAHLDAFIVDFQREKDKDLRKDIFKTLSKINDANNDHSEALTKLRGGLTAAEQAELNAFLKAFGDADREKHPAPRPAGDFPTPDPEGPTVARPTPDAQTMCELVGEAVGECNRDGWGNPYCQELKRKLDGCADPKVTDPEPGADTCFTPTIDPEKVQEVILLLCTAKKKPVPGEDPCKPMQFVGEARTHGIGPDNPEGCNDPRVRTTGETCLPTFTLIQFDEPDAQTLLKKMFKKLGGPIFVVPVDAPHPLPPTPFDIPK